MDSSTSLVRAECGAGKLLLAALQERIGTQKFNAWFGHGTKLCVDDHHVKLTVPNPFVANWIDTNYHSYISEAVEKHIEGDRRILITIDSALSGDLRRNQLDTQAQIVNKATHGRSRQRPASQTVRLKHKLADFVVGDSNRLAYSAATAMAQPALAPFNPLFIHGSCGLGKTHLLQGICKACESVRTNGKPAKWRYVTAEQFTNEFISALRSKRIDAFRQDYRRVDMLAIDDVHFLASKKATQEEFLHTFNSLQNAGGKIVMASDAHPRQVRELSLQLVSRFVAGMVVAIQPPDCQTRIRMLQAQAERMKLRVSDDVLSYIAMHIRGSVRELEGSLIKLAAMAGLAGQKITMSLAAETLADHLARTDSALTLGEIEDVVAAYFGMTPADLHSSRRTKSVSAARMLAAYLARRHTRMSYPEIGRAMGKNHSSIVLAVQRMEQLITQGGEVSWTSSAGQKSCQAKKLAEMLAEQIF